MRNLQEISIRQANRYISGENTLKEIYQETKSIPELSHIKFDQNFIVNLLQTVGYNVVNCKELNDKIRSPTRKGLINLLSKYQLGDISEIELELWADAYICWEIVQKLESDTNLESIILELSFGSDITKEEFTNDVINQIKYIFSANEHREIEDLKLALVFQKPKRKFALCLNEFFIGETKKLQKFLKENTKSTSLSTIETLTSNATKSINQNLKLIDKFILNEII